MAAGTGSGRVYIIDRMTGTCTNTPNYDTYAAQRGPITCIHMKDEQSVVTSSLDGTLYIQSLKPQIKPWSIDFPGEGGISYFCHVDPDRDNEFLVAFQSGRCIHYK